MNLKRKKFKIHRSLSPLLMLWIIGVIFLGVLFSGCAHRPAEKPIPVQTNVSDLLFEQAKQSQQQGALDQALSYYSIYLSYYPEGIHSAEILLRMGNIYSECYEYEIALRYYRRLIDTMWDRPEADSARLAVIGIMIKTGRYDEALQIATDMLMSDLSPEIRQQLWDQLAQFDQNAGSPTTAVRYNYLIYQAVPADEKAQWIPQLGDAIGRLEADDIVSLWDVMDDAVVRSYLMYRYALLQVMSENYDDALHLLNGFQAMYPDHEFSDEASYFIEILSRRLSFAPATVGCLLPLSGNFKQYGLRALNGLETALSLLSNGETQSPIKLIIRDTASQDEKAVQAVRDLAEIPVAAIIGPITTASAAAREAQRLNIPMVTFTQKPEITAVGDYIFRHFITPQEQVNTLAAYLCDDLGLRDFAIMYPEETYGRTFMELFWDALVRRGGRLKGVEAYDTTLTDFTEPIQKLVGLHYPIPTDLQVRSPLRVKEDPFLRTGPVRMDNIKYLLPDPIARLSGLFFLPLDDNRRMGLAKGRRVNDSVLEPIVDFDAVFIPDAPKKAAMILPQLTYHDVKDIYLVGTNLWHSDQLIEMTRDYAQNAIMVDGFFKQSSTPAVRRFVEQFNATFGRDPGIVEAFAFDTANLMFALLARPDIQFRHCLRDAMTQMLATEGATGPTAFTDTGEPVKTLSLLRVKGGRFVEITRP